MMRARFWPMASDSNKRPSGNDTEGRPRVGRFFFLAPALAGAVPRRYL